MSNNKFLEVTEVEAEAREVKASEVDDDGFYVPGDVPSAQWEVSGNIYTPCGRVEKRLLAGTYTIKDTPRGVVFLRHENNTDELLVLPDTQSEKIVSYVKDFWEKEASFRKYGYLWKRGVLLYGPPGSGKTSTIHIVTKMITERDGIVLYVRDPELGDFAISSFREIEPTRPLVVVLEDVDGIIKHREDNLLSLLDGENQVDNVMYIATTNYLDRLPPRLINRPSRFDIIEEIGMPNADARRVYIDHVLSRANDSVENMDEWVAKTEGMSVAHIKDVIISVKVFDLSLDDAVLRMLKMMGCSSDDIKKTSNKYHLRKTSEEKALEVDCDFSNDVEIAGNSYTK